MMPRLTGRLKLIKLAIWVVFVAMALSAIFDFDDWADSAA